MIIVFLDAFLAPKSGARHHNSVELQSLKPNYAELLVGIHYTKRGQPSGKTYTSSHTPHSRMTVVCTRQTPSNYYIIILLYYYIIILLYYYIIMLLYYYIILLLYYYVAILLYYFINILIYFLLLYYFYFILFYFILFYFWLFPKQCLHLGVLTWSLT